jgi:hypothetical protein
VDGSTITATAGMITAARSSSRPGRRCQGIVRPCLIQAATAVTAAAHPTTNEFSTHVDARRKQIVASMVTRVDRATTRVSTTPGRNAW